MEATPHLQLGARLAKASVCMPANQCLLAIARASACRAAARPWRIEEVIGASRDRDHRRIAISSGIYSSGKYSSAARASSLHFNGIVGAL